MWTIISRSFLFLFFPDSLNDRECRNLLGKLLYGDNYFTLTFCHSMGFTTWKTTLHLFALSHHGWKMEVSGGSWTISLRQIGCLW